ncbi:hypothetical protein [Luteipulveratus halotolerans]|nr:hypothetical protein [Luteipulveratus halotolerans]
MSRRTKMTVAAAGLGVVAAGAVTVPALAATGSGGPSTAVTNAPSATTDQQDDSGSPEKSAGGPRIGLRLFGASTAEVAQAAGATEAQLQQGLRDGKSLTQIAASHGVAKATLVARLGTLVDKHAATVVDRKVGSGGPDGGGARTSPLADALADLVKKGTITQAQADAITQAVESKRSSMPGPDGARHEIRRGGGGLLGEHAAALASTLKLSESELTSQLRSGKSLADIAAAQGVSRDTLVKKVSALLKSDLSTLVDRTMPTIRAGKGPADLPNLPQRQGDSSEQGSSSGGTSADGVSAAVI